MATLILRSNCGAPYNGSGQTGGGGGGTFLRNHHRSSSSDNQDSDYAIINLPLQCDVTLVPRITIPNNNNNNNNNNNVPLSTIHKLHTLKVPNQVLNPCGINNIISIDNQELFNTNEGEDDDNGNGANYLLSLTHCVVNIDMENNDNKNITSLPVTSNPSTFQFTFHKEKNDKESTWGENNNDVDTVFYTNGKVHRVGEIHTSFDYTTAIEYYQENVRKNQQQQKNDEVCNKLHNNNSTTIHNTKRSNPEVTSIMISLEEESRFIKQTLTVLGCLGVAFTFALVWTLSKMSSTKKKVRRRRVIVNDSWRYSVPREVVDTGKDDSVKTDEGHATPLVDNVSPLSTVMNTDEQPTDIVAAVTTSNEESKANHETLHLVSPFTPLQPVAAEDTKKQQDNDARADMNKSPRHWYEDFLSPQNDDGKEKNAPTKFSFTAKNEVSRSLFSPLKASAAAKNDVPSNKGGEVVAVAVVEELPKDTNKKLHHLPRKELDFDTPIERSDFSPPQSSVNMLSLPIESEITFDSGCDMLESAGSVPQVPDEETTEEIPVGSDDTTLSLNHATKQEEASFTADEDTPFELEESNIVSEIGCQPGTLTLSQINVDESSIVKSEWSMSQELSNVEEISSNGSTIYEYVPMEEDGDAKDDKVGELDSVDKQSSVSEVAEMKDTQDDAMENSSPRKIASSSKSPVSDVVDSSTPKPTKTPKRLTPVPTPRATTSPDTMGGSSDEMFSDYW